MAAEVWEPWGHPDAGQLLSVLERRAAEVPSPAPGGPMLGWRLYAATAKGLVSPFAAGRPVSRSQVATCQRLCVSVPGPGCTCGWYFCETVASLRPLVVGYQHHVARYPESTRAVALVGVRVSRAVHNPSPFNNRAGREAIRLIEDVSGVRYVAPIEGDGTYRGRRATIVGPIVTNLDDPATISRMRQLYVEDVHPTSRTMLETIDAIEQAGHTYGHTPQAVGPHLTTLLSPRRHRQKETHNAIQ